jgi:hypothetical protein
LIEYYDQRRRTQKRPSTGPGTLVRHSTAQLINPQFLAVLTALFADGFESP